jgi:hypothetical protein
VTLVFRDKALTRLVEAVLKVKKTATTLLDLEGLVAQLLSTARKLPPGPDRAKAFEEIGRFRLRIADLQAANRTARRGLKAKKK